MKTKQTKEKKYKVTPYLVTSNFGEWIEKHFSYALALKAEEKAREQGWFSLTKLPARRMTLKEVKFNLIKDYGRMNGSVEFLVWKWENEIP